VTFDYTIFDGKTKNTDEQTFIFDGEWLTEINAQARQIHRRQVVPPGEVMDPLAVGEGPFPTEQDNETGKLLGTRGHEFGTVTGRPRRCGWFDAVLVRQTCTTSGAKGIALTKLDVLDGFAELKICVAYDLDGARIEHLPTAAALQARVTPIYETLPGWSETTAGARSWAELPAAAIKYVRRIEELIGCPVAMLSTSPERDDTILVTDPFAG